MKYGFFMIAALMSATSFCLHAESVDEQKLQEIIVTGTFRGSDLLTVPASFSVIDSTTIGARSAEHLEDILNAAANVNFATGGSRGRHIQIRGIGERSQFVDPIDPSVGLIIDDIDVSGLGGVATLYDVAQVEVLRGPQSTRFGASALAGMVNIRSNEPTADFETGLEATAGNYHTRRLSAVVNGPMTDSLLGRIAVQRQASDGFIDNDYLGRNDTNDRNELTARGKLRWQPSDAWQGALTGFYIDADNGYDAFALDNNRHTLSDEPGQDSQNVLGLAVTSTWAGNPAFIVKTIATWLDADSEYGYDEDWSFNGLCTGTPCAGWEYSSTDNYRRDRDSRRVELRLTSTEAGRFRGSVNWLAGVYFDRRDESLQREFFDWILFTPDAQFSSHFVADKFALYGELSRPLGDRLTATLGMRWERFEADYDDSRGVKSSPEDDLWGGQISLVYQAAENTLIYGSISRGYKVGGVNGEALGRAKSSGFPESVNAFLSSRLEFATETLVNWELGVKGSYLDDALLLRMSAFYMDRNDIQLKGWYNEGPLFVEYIDNAGSGENLGAELEALWRLNEQIQLFANIGWLDTEIDNFVVNVDAELVDKSGREQAHAPNYQFNIGGQFNWADGFYGRLEMEGKDAFYFSDSHDQRAGRHELINASLGYQRQQWDLSLWARNLTDQNYQTRGFFFGNDPRKFYANEPYYQYGEPRVFGVTVKYQL